MKTDIIKSMNRNGRKTVFDAVVLPLVIIAFLQGVPFSVNAEEPFKMPTFNAKDMVPLVHGPNWVDLDGDGHKDLVMKSRLNAPNPSPHSSSTYNFFLYTNEDIGFANTNIHWYGVPFVGLDKVERQGIQTNQGVYCLTSDIRLLLGKRIGRSRVAYIIEAGREIGESFGDSNEVIFIVYRLERGSVASVREFSFIEQVRFAASNEYCSVTQAFEVELGLRNPDLSADPDKQLE